MTIRQAVALRVTTARAAEATVPQGVTLASARSRSLAVLAIVWIFGALYESYFLFRGWFPHDEGALAESARRILAGQLPHRDFSEIYTGGLSYLHALAFLVFGERLTSMRFMLFGFFVAWIPVLYSLARRFASPSVAGACVAASIAWTVPNYSASMPSWYNLFLATFAVALFLRYCDNRRSRWLVAAGFACGTSFTIKSTGAYIVLALLLALVFDAQLNSAIEEPAGKAWTVFRTAGVCLCSAATVAFLIALVHRRLGLAEAANFIVPGTCVAVLLAWLALRRPVGVQPPILPVLRPMAWFGLGVSLPIAALVTPYVVSGSLDSLLHGVLVEPSARLRFASMAPPPVSSLPVTAVLLSCLLAIGYASSGARSARFVFPGVLTTFLLVSATPLGYQLTWTTVRDASIFIVPVGVALVALGVRQATSSRIDLLRTFTLLCVFAFAALIQFPFSASIYFCYVAPLMFVSMLAIAACGRDMCRFALSPATLGAVFVFLALFGFARANQQLVGGRGWIGHGTSLGLARSGSLRVSATDAHMYRQLIRKIDAVATSRYIYAGPDAPEVYFLSGHLNPTRDAFQFLEHGGMSDGQLLHLLRSNLVSVVALNTRPAFSPRLTSRMRAVLAARYPHHERIGRFVLRWRT